jgi:3-oxoacyl-[acyl-carrier protein] reductase
VAHGIRSAGGTALAVFMDLSGDASIIAAMDNVVRQWGRIDVLVNNAVQWSEYRADASPLFEDLPRHLWRDPLRANVEGHYVATQAVLSSMRRHHWGRIVNVSAVAAEDGFAGGAWYAAAKSALHGLTRSVAREVGIDGILVNAVMPGYTLTERTRQLVSPEVLAQHARSSSIGRLLVPQEIAATVVYLCSTANAAITGECIRASGGFVVPHKARLSSR